jgi:4-oxalocrotonate tautomerase
VPLIQVKVVAGVFTAQQKHEIIERLTDAMVAIEGESMRQSTWCLVEEVASGAWGIGGQPITADDERALARG